MVTSRSGSLRLFSFSGIQVHVHWSWFIAAAYVFSTWEGRYTSPVWAMAVYVALFAIVVLHEFGHALACRSTGGRADEIILWPLGGIAYVAPPPRPGAQLWSIAAGPLVNVVLLPVLFLLVRLAEGRGLYETNPDLFFALIAVQDINFVLLAFNLLPIYPLDGGQILRSLLWFAVGPANSLYAATVIGLLGGAGLAALAVWRGQLMLGLVAAFLLFNCFQALRLARALRAEEAAARTAEQ
ncbi:MAG: peptidase M50 [Verrucomicrobia bacterium]|nr:MAG: peptidase M50 [Verrucomicrobiota bacterium]